MVTFSLAYWRGQNRWPFTGRRHSALHINCVTLHFYSEFMCNAAFSRLLDSGSDATAALQPPTRQEVRDRAEILDSQLLTMGYGALTCPSASRLVSESEADLREKYGDLYNTALTDLHRRRRTIGVGDSGQRGRPQRIREFPSNGVAKYSLFSEWEWGFAQRGGDRGGSSQFRAPLDDGRSSTRKTGRPM